MNGSIRAKHTKIAATNFQRVWMNLLSPFTSDESTQVKNCFTSHWHSMISSWFGLNESDWFQMIRWSTMKLQIVFFEPGLPFWKLLCPESSVKSSIDHWFCIYARTTAIRLPTQNNGTAKHQKRCKFYGYVLWQRPRFTIFRQFSSCRSFNWHLKCSTNGNRYENRIAKHGSRITDHGFNWMQLVDFGNVQFWACWSTFLESFAIQWAAVDLINPCW